MSPVFFFVNRSGTPLSKEGQKQGQSIEIMLRYYKKHHSLIYETICNFVGGRCRCLQCPAPEAKEKFQQVSVAYTRLVSGEDGDDDSGEDNERYYDNVDEMRAFMRMFMDLVGMFNDVGGAGHFPSGHKHHAHCR